MTIDLPKNYDPTQFDRPSVTVDVVIFSFIDNDLKVLLIEREEAPYAGILALPGSFVRINESLDDAATRTLADETGLTDVYSEQLYTFGSPQRDPRTRVITIAYFALVSHTLIQQHPDKQSAKAAWLSMFSLPDLAFDHEEIANYALTRLRYKLEYTSVGFELLPDVFTLTELQRAYEIILEEMLDKRNFRRKILSAKILKETGKKKKDGEGRPAKLYQYRDDAIAEIKTRRLFP